MRVGKTVLRVVLIVLLVLLAAVAYLYYKASKVPAAYRPAEGSQQERKEWAKDFMDHVLVGFSNKANRIQPFSFEIEQEELNRYLAAADEIAALEPGGKRTGVYQVMEQAGLSGYAVALGDGVLTLMVRATEYNKILSADIVFRYTDDGRLGVRLAETRVGELVVLPALVRGQMERIKETMAERVAAMKRKRKAPRDEPRRRVLRRTAVEDLGFLFAVVITAIDEEPVKPEFTVPVGKKPVRIEAIRIKPGRLTLDVVPVHKKTPPP